MAAVAEGSYLVVNADVSTATIEMKNRNVERPSRSYVIAVPAEQKAKEAQPVMCPMKDDKLKQYGFLPATSLE